MDGNAPINQRPLAHKIASFFDRFNKGQHGTTNSCLKCFALIFMMYFTVRKMN
jgi:hypothetical protein